MTQAEVKKRLLTADIAYRRYAAARDKADSYRMQLMGRAVRYEEKGGRSEGNSTEEGYMKLSELDESTDTAKASWLCAREDAERIIAMCPAEIWVQVLTYRYLNRYRFEDIAMVLGYSDRHIYRAHKKALQFLAAEL